MREVTDPRTGLASRLDWLPTVKEVRDACEAIEQPRRRKAQHEIEIRRQQEDLAKFEEARKTAPTKDELNAKGFLKGPAIAPLPAADLWRLWQQQRLAYGPQLKMSCDVRTVLVNGGYDPYSI